MENNNMFEELLVAQDTYWIFSILRGMDTTLRQKVKD